MEVLNYAVLSQHLMWAFRKAKKLAVVQPIPTAMTRALMVLNFIVGEGLSGQSSGLAGIHLLMATK
ncbi:hypothetical protein [uncultured Brevundimonas sp.]|uniref:hypothetical protein n=1 Tax=uncultured Brevundimonas sp. TaxID=213418 RepID=UPI0025FD3C10|nr:hypothetical protein [uncultured Brevundimonas sp.]